MSYGNQTYNQTYRQRDPSYPSNEEISSDPSYWIDGNRVLSRAEAVTRYQRNTMEQSAKRPWIDGGSY